MLSLQHFPILINIIIRTQTSKLILKQFITQFYDYRDANVHSLFGIQKF